MTTLQELLEQWEARSKDALPTDAMLINKHIRELRAALAQQAEQPIGYVRTINGAPTPDDDNTIFSYGANPYRDVMDKEEWVAVYKAAPAPQPAQDKSDNYLSGYCTGRTDLLKEQSAQPVAQPLTGKEIAACIPDNTDFESGVR